MFEKLDLKKTIDDETFEKPISDLKERLSILQRTLRDLNIPVIIVLEGWNAAGITLSIHEIIQSLDPRGFNLHAIDNPSDEEEARPFLWRFWLRIPSNGRFAIFARSWYSRALAEKLSSIGWKKSMKDKINSINNFERQLADNGTVIRADNGSATFSGGSVSPFFQTSNTMTKTNKPNNTEIQSPIVFGTSPSFSKNSSNGFLANNSLSLTTDLSGNNSPMLIDGETNPGDPGIPVGDGTWVFLGLLVGYGLVMRKRIAVFNKR